MSVARAGEHKQGRLAVAPGGRPLGGRAAIVLQLEQRGLARLRGLPRLKLLPAQFAEALPAKGVAIDDEGVGLCHDTLARSGRVGLSSLRRGGCGFLQVVQKICGALGVRSGAEYGALIILQRLD